MSWSCRDDSNGECSDTETVQNNGNIVEIPQDMDAKCVNETMANQQCRINTENLCSSWLESRLNRGKRSNQVRTPKCDSSRYGNYQY